MVDGLTNAILNRKINNDNFEDDEIDDDDEESDDESVVDQGPTGADAEDAVFTKSKKQKKIKTGLTIQEILMSDKVDRDTKINSINLELTKTFPPLKGDEVTFIGSTFWKYGDEKPYLNHCIVRDTCNDLGQVQNSQIDSYETEKAGTIGLD